MPKGRSKFSNVAWLRQRQLAHKFPLGTKDCFYTSLYSSFQVAGSWDHHENLRNAVHGGVYNLEFSPDGKLLVAACEKKSILMFDPLSHRMINGIDDAHTECVNCVRFLDSRVFATCSDDTTVALWDSRNLKQRIHTLRGHENWVKNIEFSSKDGLLVTSGFDGSIYTWDINNYTEKRVFHTNGLMRTRLNPDASKMIICTTSGYLMIVHDLDLAHLGQDLAGFKPNMYRLMQQNHTIYPGGMDFTYLFSSKQKRNRVEFITDFPKGVDAEVISSLQIHPQGWCALSRNVSNDESSEWTCVHDIQERPDVETDDTEEEGDYDEVFPSPPPSPTVPPMPRRTPRPAHRTDFRSDDEDSRRIRRIGEIVRRGGTYTANVELHVSSSDVWEAIVAVREARMSRQRERETPNPAPENRSNRFAVLVNRHVEEEGTQERSRNLMGDPRGPVSGNQALPNSGNPIIIFRDLSQGSGISRHRLPSMQQNVPVHNSANYPPMISPGQRYIPASHIWAPEEPTQSRRRRHRVNYDELRRRNSEYRIARLPEVHDIDINQQMPILHGLAATMVQTLAGNGSSNAGADTRVLAPAEVPASGPSASASGGPERSAHQHLLSTRNALRASFLPRVERLEAWYAAGVNRINVPAGEGSSVDISITTRSSNQTRNSQNDNLSQGGSSRSDNATSSSDSSAGRRYKIHRKYKVHQNLPRLLNYIEEPNVGKGFIKELCFSSDGRLICSPFAFGVRLLAFNPNCSELSTSVPNTPSALFELKTNICHGNTVVSTKFSPQHCLLVSGCLNGKIVWHQPNLC